MLRKCHADSLHPFTLYPLIKDSGLADHLRGRSSGFLLCSILRVFCTVLRIDCHRPVTGVLLAGISGSGRKSSMSNSRLSSFRVFKSAFCCSDLSHSSLANSSSNVPTLSSISSTVISPFLIDRYMSSIVFDRHMDFCL